MPRYFLTGVEIEGFRGINNEGDPLRLQFRSDSVNSVFAPNAQGKSSIFEALCFAIRGHIPKLEELPAAEHASEYYTNRFHQGRQATIVIVLEPDDGGPAVQVRVRRLADGARQVDSPSGHSMPEGLLHALDTPACLVDHRAFLRFVADAPLPRGRTFSGLLGIGRLSEVRRALEVLAHGRTLKGDFELDRLEAEVRATNGRLTGAQNRVRRAHASLTNKHLTDPIDLNAVASKAAEALAQVELLKPFLIEGDVRKVDWDSVRTSIRRVEQSEKQVELMDLGHHITALEALAPQPGDHESRSALREAAEARDKAIEQTKGPLFKKLYEVALEILESPDWDTPNRCPACESILDRSLATQLREQLREYRAVADCSNEIRTSWIAAPWADRLKRLTNSEHLPATDRRSEQVAAADARLARGEASRADVDELVELAEHHERVRITALQKKASQRESLRAELPPSLVALTEQVGHAEELSRAIADMANSAEALDSLSSQLATRMAWSSFIQEAAATFGSAEAQLSTRKTQELEAAYQSIYQEITNNPEIVPSLEKAAGSEELHLVLRRFYGLADVSAPTLLPESYRNALAISIFLSAVLRDQSLARFIVMDDVTSSFDAGHQFALMELIRRRIARPGNMDGPQVILLSHDGLLEKYFDRIAADGFWYHQRIQGLPPRGSVLTQAQDANRHRSGAERFLLAGQVDQAEPLVRQYLEFRLQQVVRKVNVPVPFDFAMRDDRKQVQSCIDAIMQAVDLHRGAGRLILQPTQVNDLERYHVPALIANWVSHYATGISASFTPHVLLGILDTIDKFVDCFCYDCKCSGAVRRRFYRDLASKGCGC